MTGGRIESAQLLGDWRIYEHSHPASTTAVARIIVPALEAMVQRVEGMDVTWTLTANRFIDVGRVVAPNVGVGVPTGSIIGVADRRVTLVTGAGLILGTDATLPGGRATWLPPGVAWFVFFATTVAAEAIRVRMHVSRFPAEEWRSVIGP